MGALKTVAIIGSGVAIAGPFAVAAAGGASAGGVLSAGVTSGLESTKGLCDVGSNVSDWGIQKLAI